MDIGRKTIHSPLKWRETLPSLPFLLLLCVPLPMALVWADQLFFPQSLMLSRILMPYIIFPIASLFFGLSLGKRQGFCILYPIAVYLLHAPIALWLFKHYFYLFFADILFTFALIGNIVGAKRRRCDQEKQS